LTLHTTDVRITVKLNNTHSPSWYACLEINGIPADVPEVMGLRVPLETAVPPVFGKEGMPGYLHITKAPLFEVLFLFEGK
jgi:hypothetical protein